MNVGKADCNSALAPFGLSILDTCTYAFLPAVPGSGISGPLPTSCPSDCQQFWQAVLAEPSCVGRFGQADATFRQLAQSLCGAAPPPPLIVYSPPPHPSPPSPRAPPPPPPPLPPRASPPLPPTPPSLSPPPSTLLDPPPPSAPPAQPSLLLAPAAAPMAAVVVAPMPAGHLSAVTAAGSHAQNSSSSSSLSTGTVVGISITGAVVGAGLVAGGMFVSRWMRQRRAARQAASTKYGTKKGIFSMSRQSPHRSTAEIVPDRLSSQGAHRGPQLLPHASSLEMQCAGNTDAAVETAGIAAKAVLGSAAPIQSTQGTVASRTGLSSAISGVPSSAASHDPLLTFIAGMVSQQKTMSSRATKDSMPTDPSLIVQWEDLQIGASIGQGSFGKVYSATWHETPVAVKVSLKHAAMTAGAPDHGTHLDAPVPSSCPNSFCCPQKSNHQCSQVPVLARQSWRI